MASITTVTTMAEGVVLLLLASIGLGFLITGRELLVPFIPLCFVIVRLPGNGGALLTINLLHILQ